MEAFDLQRIARRIIHRTVLEKVLFWQEIKLLNIVHCLSGLNWLATTLIDIFI
jgi:hypothetical protein